ncbi:MAG: hemerythrin domain-containing protein [Steroidobacteraceae bacterium]
MKKNRKNVGAADTKPSEKESALKAGERFLSCLRADHADCSRVLSLLSRQANHLIEHPRDALPLIYEAFQFITVYLDARHHPREDVLYAHLGRRSQRLARALRALNREHARGAVVSQQIAAEIQRLMTKADSCELEALQEAIDEFVDQQRAHIAAEERVMYSTAIASLSTQDWRSIEAAAPRHEARSTLSHRGNRSYPLLERHFHSSAPHHMAGTNGTLRLGLHKATDAYGKVVGHALEAGWIALRQNREALALVMQSLRAVCTPQRFPAYTAAVRTAYRADIDTMARWTDEWREHLVAAQHNVRSMCR